ncbi:MAG: hypothetical protein OIF51_14435 [Cellvibrionaceae bacterium]|nr:hypothetical protein [Cellvibrionaceae bacterium]
MRFVVVILFSFLFGAKNALAQVDAPPALVPSGLNPGDEFFVIFVSSGTDNLCREIPPGPPFSPMDDTAAINLANTAATTGTLTSSVAGWQALYIHERSDALGAITDTVAASGIAFNNNVTQPIYNVRGDLIANNRTDMFDGGVAGGGTDLINPILYDENGAIFPTNSFAYTGFDGFGMRTVGRTLGYGGAGCAVGEPDRTDAVVIGPGSPPGSSNWADFSNSASSRGIYVLSPLLRVPLASTNATGVPVAPYGFALVLGLLMLVGVGRKLKKY